MIPVDFDYNSHSSQYCICEFISIDIQEGITDNWYCQVGAEIYATVKIMSRIVIPILLLDFFKACVTNFSRTKLCHLNWLLPGIPFTTFAITALVAPVGNSMCNSVPGARNGILPEDIDIILSWKTVYFPDCAYSYWYSVWPTEISETNSDFRTSIGKCEWIRL